MNLLKGPQSSAVTRCLGNCCCAPGVVDCHTSLACCAACSESVALCMPSSSRLHAHACTSFRPQAYGRCVGRLVGPALDSGCREKGFRKKGPALLTCDHTAKKISQHTHTHRTAWGLGSKLKLKKQQLQLWGQSANFCNHFPVYMTFGWIPSFHRLFQPFSLLL